MNIYLVGGAVRDTLMGLPIQDRDWVVVGATPRQLLERGFIAVGRDFPVFLHPTSKEEYALARTERKTGPGYRGFAVHCAPDVSLHDDLGRRDITINSIAISEEFINESSPIKAEPAAMAAAWQSAGVLLDPYGGCRDIANKVLRHVSPAFSEDPVRLLRVARFAARFVDFTVAPETQALMSQMVQHGELDHLVPERVWQELSRGLMQTRPSRMFEVLRQCGALKRLLPEVERLWGVPQSVQHHPEIDTGAHLMLVLDMAAQLHASLDVRFACLMHDLGKGTTPLSVLPRHIGHEQRSVRLLGEICQRLRVPAQCSDLARVVAREHGNIHRSDALNAAGIVRLLERCDAFRKPERFLQILLACECDARGRLGLQDKSYTQAVRLRRALDQARSVATNVIAAKAMQSGITGPKLGAMIQAARTAAIAADAATH